MGGFGFGNPFVRQDPFVRDLLNDPYLRARLLESGEQAGPLYGGSYREADQPLNFDTLDVKGRRWRPPLPREPMVLPEPPPMAAPDYSGSQLGTRVPIDIPEPGAIPPPMPNEIAAPGGNTLMVGAPREDVAALQRPKGPGVLARFKEAAPRMMTGALAAMATPNIAGGTAPDLARAAIAGQGAIEAIDTKQAAKARQARQDVMDMYKYGSEEDLRRAQAENQRAQAEYHEWRTTQEKKPPSKKEPEILFEDWQKETDPIKKEEAWSRYLQSKNVNPRRYVKLPDGVLYDTEKGEVVKTISPTDKMKERLKMLGLPETTDVKTLPSDQMEFVLTEKYTQPKSATDTNLTQSELFLQAAGGDPVKAVAMMTQFRRTGVGADGRAEKRHYENMEVDAQRHEARELSAIEDEYQTEKAILDSPKSKTPRPDLAEFVEDARANPKKAQLMWDEYNRANQALVNKKTAKLNALDNFLDNVYKVTRPGYVVTPDSYGKPPDASGGAWLPPEQRPTVPAPTGAPGAPAPGAPAPGVRTTITPQDYSNSGSVPPPNYKATDPIARQYLDRKKGGGSAGYFSPFKLPGR